MEPKQSHSRLTKLSHYNKHKTSSLFSSFWPVGLLCFLQGDLSQAQETCLGSRASLQVSEELLRRSCVSRFTEMNLGRVLASHLRCRLV